MKKILHITNWYPNLWDNLDGVFVKEQYKVFSEVTEGHLIHVQVRKSNKYIKYEYMKYSKNEEAYYLLTKIKSTKLIEILTTLLLLWVLIKSKYKEYDLIHFHIAYPLLVYYHIWKRIIKKPILISEHWSAYHFNFYLAQGSKKLKKIKRIFQQQIPIITVSHTLGKDIQLFSNSYDFPLYVIPNIINEKIFYLRDIPKNDIVTFFIVNYWNAIKNPFPVLKAFAKVKLPYILKIGGYGDLYGELKLFTQKYKMENKVIFLEKMTSEEIRDTMNESDMYLYTSHYETFSIICVEALFCGVPIMGPKLEAILEYTDKENSIYVEKNEEEYWLDVLNSYLKKQPSFSRFDISKKSQIMFSNKSIKSKYLRCINKEKESK